MSRWQLKNCNPAKAGQFLYGNCVFYTASAVSQNTAAKLIIWAEEDGFCRLLRAAACCRQLPTENSNRCKLRQTGLFKEYTPLLYSAGLFHQSSRSRLQFVVTFWTSSLSSRSAIIFFSALMSDSSVGVDSIEGRYSISASTNSYPASLRALLTALKSSTEVYIS